MKGYGLSVFHGTEPERFDVEVIGVLHNFRPGQPLIVVKTGGNLGTSETDKRLDVVKTVRGMSGSPIYLEGRLAGAYAYSLSMFESEAVAGVTPIDLMLAEMRRPIPPGFWPTEHAAPLPAGTSEPDRAAPAARLDRDVRRRARHVRRVGARSPARRSARHARGSGSATDHARGRRRCMMGGVGDRTAAALRKLVEPLGLEPLQGGGGGGGNDPNAPGGTSSTAEASASSSSAATCPSWASARPRTPTAQGKVAGFGHPMLGGGDEALPSCIGRVVWINASAPGVAQGRRVRTLDGHAHPGPADGHHPRRARHGARHPGRRRDRRRHRRAEDALARRGHGGQVPRRRG